MLRLRGGAKKRKKKSYTTPKKNKHKRKKVKLAVLKYYKVRSKKWKLGKSVVLIRKGLVVEYKAFNEFACTLAYLQSYF